MLREITMKVAVIGGGVFGCTTALKLDSLGFDVCLIERNKELLLEASFTNQYRIHMGYHYPRSEKTIIESKLASKKFELEFNEAIIAEVDQLYAVAKNNSRTSFEQYLKILEENKLSFEICTNLDFEVNNISGVIKSTENLFCPVILKSLLEKRIAASNISLVLGTTFAKKNIKDFDQIVLCCYSGNWAFSEHAKAFSFPTRFQIVEKIVVEPTINMKNKSIVVLDGNFSSFDPFSRTGLSVIGHVSAAVHNTEFGSKPPKEFAAGNLSKNLGKYFASNYQSIIALSQLNLPELNKCRYVKSMWAIRAVPESPRDDSRPTIVRRLSENIVSVYSGKIASSTVAAEKVAAFIKNV